MFVENIKQYWDYVCSEDVSFAELAICICSKTVAESHEHLIYVMGNDGAIDMSKIGEVRRLFAEYVVDKDYMVTVGKDEMKMPYIEFRSINGTVVNVKYGENFVDALPEKPTRSRCEFDYFFKDANDLARLLIILRQK